MQIVRKILVTQIILLLLCFRALGQNLPEKFQAKQFINQTGDTLNYRIFIPEETDSTGFFPLVLFLHGAGERGSDNKAQLTHGVWRFVEDSVQKKHPSIVVAPQAPKDTYWANAKWRTESTALMENPAKPLSQTMELVEQLQHDFKIDSSRMYVTGLSMGGFGTWDLIVRYPDFFAAAVPVCAGGDTTKAHRITELPVWNFHGAEDTIVPPELSRQMIDAIRTTGGKPGYNEYPDVGHGSWIYAYREPYLVDWLFSKIKEGTVTY